MTGSISDALPWPNSKKDETATTSETTSGAEEPTRWVVVAEHLNPAEAAIIKSRLSSERIPAVVQRKESSIFAITVGPMSSTKVLVPEPLAERALNILAETFEGEEDEYWDKNTSWDNEIESDVDC